MELQFINDKGYLKLTLKGQLAIDTLQSITQNPTFETETKEFKRYGKQFVYVVKKAYSHMFIGGLIEVFMNVGYYVRVVL